MTPERAKELLPVIQAYAEGKDVEFRAEGGGWRIGTNLSFDTSCDYRIKPQSTEVWAVVRDDGTPLSVYSNEENAKIGFKNYPCNCRVVHLKEVA